MSTLWKAPLPHFILNALYLHDLWVIKKLSKWSDSTYDMRLDLTKQLEMVDSIMPWIHLKFINPDWIFPVISDDLAAIQGVSLAHPLLKSYQSISNPLDPIQKGEVLLITGSNMAGKTTFMRTVGVNILFALCGVQQLRKIYHFLPFL
jgi:DNA mismatch repair ATPase MutS